MKEKSRLRAPGKIRSDSRATRLKAWAEHQELLKTKPDDQAVKGALRKAAPPKDDPYYSQFHANKQRELGVWKKHGLWPPPELKEQDTKTERLTASDTVEVTEEELQQVFRKARKPKMTDEPSMSDTVRMTEEEIREAIESGQKGRQEKQTPPVKATRRRTLLTEDELLKKVKVILNNIEVAERPTTARGRESTLKTGMIAARFPKTLIEELETLPGRKSHHLERALILYLRAIKSED